MKMPDVLLAVAPTVGSRWTWEPGKPWAEEETVVRAVLWNGEEAWVESEGPSGLVWNTLGRWMEAAVLRDPGSDL